jgi:signal transduction histidine kinase/CheY-like chemotaxis protein
MLALRVYAVSAVFFGVALAAIFLSRRKFLLAQVVWQTGMAATILLALIVYQSPLIALFLGLLPLLAVIVVNVYFGVLLEGVIIVLVAILTRLGLVSGFGPEYIVWVSIFGCISVLIGWVVSQSLVNVAEWSLVEYHKAREEIEEAREQRVEMKQIQEDLQHANNELAHLASRLKVLTQVAEEAKHTKEEFLANVSHELRTPLNMIIGFSEMIIQSPEVYGGKQSPKLLADITTIYRNSQHLSRLVNDVLDLSQAEAGRMTLKKEWVPIADIINSAIVAIRPFYETKNLYLDVVMPGEFPPVFCDSTRIRQVLLNLLSNAGRFTNKGGVRLHVQKQSGEFVVTVADTGPGIPAEDQARIFDPFEQVDQGMNRSSGGNGLGLSISKRFIEMHEGRMWLESILGQGTTFYFTLPVEQRMPISPELSRTLRWYSSDLGDVLHLRRRRAPAPTYQPEFVVWERENSLSALLRKHTSGLNIVTVHDSESADAELARSSAQALIINTAGSEGSMASFEKYYRAGELPYHTPVIQCWMPGKQEVNEKMGIVRYLVKPINGETLLASIQASANKVKKILLVEDNLEVQQLMVRQLSNARMGYRVLRAGDGTHALQIMREQRPDLVLLDLILPGEDGHQVLKTKSQDPLIRDIPVIVISSIDPEGRYNLGNHFTLFHPSELTIMEFVTCVLSFSEILFPASEPARPTPVENPGD